MYLADTSFLIDLVQNEPGAVEIAKEIDNQHVLVFISTITVQEYLRGVYYLFADDQPQLERKLFEAESDLAHFNVIEVDYQIAKIAASIDAELTINGEQIGFADVVIAATAITFNLQLITKNTKHFERIRNLKIRVY
ncbi:MAG: PIN domain-containing protein [Candidatus Kariarchaeaceae archaeon]